MRADTKEKYDEFLNDLNIKQAVLRDQIKTKTGVSRTRLENLVNVAKNILDRVILYHNMPELESEEPTEQKGQGLKILTPNQMLSRLPLSLAQLNTESNSEKLKKEIRKLLYSLYRS